MRKLALSLAALAVAVFLVHAAFPGLYAGAAEPRMTARPPADDAASLELKRQQLAEREAALKAKEEELSRVSATLDARVNELNAAKKGIEASLSAKKKQEDERHKKMVKILKGLKPEQAGNLINKLEPKMIIDLLNEMDQKTAIKLIPFITQPRVLEWTRQNLGG